MNPGLNKAPASAVSAAAAIRLRRGACPTLEAPMETGDGLLTRIRIAGACLTPAQLYELARLASEHGNGLVEITARGNLQVRGLTQTSAAAFAEAISSQLTVESGLVVDLSPIAGMDPQEIADPRPLVRRIKVEATSIAPRLGPKVSVVVDGGGQIPLEDYKADIRLQALTGQRWAVTLGGGKAQEMDAHGAVAATLALLNALAALGPEARALDLFPSTGTERAAAPRRGARPMGTRFALRNGHATAIALPFGSARSADLMALCEVASANRVTTLRLAPDHALLIDDAPDIVVDRATQLDFITSASDPRRRISACSGRQGCASGHIMARTIAQGLAAYVQPDQRLHVSGCAKGCAHPRRAEVTLVGRPDGIGLVIDGRAGDTPMQILDEARLADALVHNRDGR